MIIDCDDRADPRRHVAGGDSPYPRLVWNDLEATYHHLCAARTDISEHLPVLRHYASRSNVVVEMGVRTAVSTFALLAAHPRELVSVDIAPLMHPLQVEIERLAKIAGTKWRFHQESTLTMIAVECDMLFIDTLHTCGQLAMELSFHAPHCRRWIALHDTVTFGAVGEDGKSPGLRCAVDDYVRDHDEWRVLEDLPNNNGLLVLARR